MGHARTNDWVILLDRGSLLQKEMMSRIGSSGKLSCL